MFDPARLVFIDETCTNGSDGSAARPRLGVASGSVDYAPHGHWKTITFVAGLPLYVADCLAKRQIC